MGTFGIPLVLPATTYAVTGNDWLGYSQAGKYAYIHGVVDTYNYHHSLYETVLKTNPQEKQSIAESLDGELVLCLRERNITYGQMNAIVQKYMDDNPAKWHVSMSSLVWNAIFLACK